MEKINFVFCGTGEIAVGVLDELENAEMPPALVVTAPDKPQGRKLVLTPPPVKIWALERGIGILQPEELDSDFIQHLYRGEPSIPLIVVVDYGKFLPKALLDIPARGVINMHPSLLPRLRGPSPIRSAILNDEKNTGVSIMRVDEKMDHGPIIAQRAVPISDWPPRGRELDGILAREGGRLLATTIPHWVSGEIEAHEQNHDVATYSHMFKKEDGLLYLENGDALPTGRQAYQNLLKIRAFDGWPGTYAYFDPSTRSGQGTTKKIRVKILDAHLENDTLVIDAVKPEGKKEMSFAEFAKSGFVTTVVT